MLKRTGISAILAILVLFACLHVGLSDAGISLKVLGSTLLGGLAFLLMAISNLLATRPRFLEGAFGGLDRMYQVHKISGTTAGVLVLLHFPVSPDAVPTGVAASKEALLPSAPLGMYAMILMIILLALTLNRKVAYHLWRLPHKAMGLVFALAFLHVLFAPAFFVDLYGPSGLMLMGAGVIGLLSYGYSMVIMVRVTSSRYRVEAVNKLERATEVVLAPLGRPLTFTAGQFAFLKIRQSGLGEPHPFSISSGQDDDRLRFTIKGLGDWTRRVGRELAPGTEVDVRGPYGRFDTILAGDMQIWVAGGIGIAPFLSMARTLRDGDQRRIVCFYAVRDAAEALYLDELRARFRSLPNMKLVLLDSKAGDSCALERLKQEVGPELTGFNVFLCGPAAMTSALTRQLKAEGVAARRIHKEAFEFR